MMSLETIRALSREQAERAAQEGMRPYVFFEPSEIEDCPRSRSPTSGTTAPKAGTCSRRCSATRRAWERRTSQP